MNERAGPIFKSKKDEKTMSTNAKGTFLRVLAKWRQEQRRPSMPHQSELTEPRPSNDNNVFLLDLHEFAPDNLGWVGIVPTSTFLEKMVLHEVVQVVSPAQDRAPHQRAESHSP